MATNQFEAAAQNAIELSRSRSRAEIDEFEAEAERQAHAARIGAMSRFGVPKRIRGMIPDGISDTRAIKRVVEWHGEQQRDESNWCLVLSAQPGTGKSTAAGVWLWLRTAGVVGFNACERVTRPDLGTSANAQRWFSASEIAAASGFDGSVDSLCAMRALVFDDLGTEYTDRRGYVKTRLDVIIDSRYREFRPTLITTNLNVGSFRERYGERVADRLREGGAWFEFQAGSMRSGK